ncbi:hypothetical protein AAMO2058_001568700 [Amorphochlora amoebiformis]
MADEASKDHQPLLDESLADEILSSFVEMSEAEPREDGLEVKARLHQEKEETLRTVSKGDDQDSSKDDEKETKEVKRKPTEGKEEKKDENIFSLEEMMGRAAQLVKENQQRFGCEYYLYCLERSMGENNFSVAGRCLRYLGNICAKNGKYREAVKYRHAEKLLYESTLLRHIYLEEIKGQTREKSENKTKIKSAGEGCHLGEKAKNPKSEPKVTKSESKAEARMKTRETTPGTSPTRVIDPEQKKPPLVIKTKENKQDADKKSTSDPNPSLKEGKSGEGKESKDSEHMVTAKDVLPTKMTPSLKEAQARAFEKIAELFYHQGNKEMAKSYAIKAIKVRRLKDTGLNTQYIQASSEITKSFGIAKEIYSQALSSYEKREQRRRLNNDMKKAITLGDIAKDMKIDENQTEVSVTSVVSIFVIILAILAAVGISLISMNQAQRRSFSVKVARLLHSFGLRL